MAIRFMDSFSHYDTAHINAKWTTQAAFSVNTIETGSGRCLQDCLQVAQAGGIVGNGPFWHVPSSGLTDGVIGSGFRYTATDSAPSGNIVFGLYKNGILSGNSQCALIVFSNGTLGLVRFSDTSPFEIELVRSTRALNASSWHFVEWLFSIKATGGHGEIWVDGDQWATYDGDTTRNVDGYTDIQCGVGRGSGIGVLQFSDFYYGDAQTDRKGDSRVYARLPNADGDHRDWAPKTGTVHYVMVNENPPDDDGSYNSDLTPGDRDTYEFPVIGIPSGVVYAVQVCALMKKDDVGFRSAAVTVRQAGVDYDGDVQSIADGTYVYYLQMYDGNDPSGSPWSVSTAVNDQFGAKLVA